MHLATIIFALALSIDGLGVGVAYGIKNIAIPITSILLMCCCAITAIAVSMAIGHSLAYFVSPQIANKVGASVLIVMGLWYIAGAFLNRKDHESTAEASVIATLKLRPFYIVVQILREPTKADLDSSGQISHKEALFLGVALALDGLASGIAAAMAGFNFIYTSLLVGLCEFILVKTGLWLGTRLQHQIFKKHSALVSGFVLCLLGLSRLYKI